MKDDDCYLSHLPFQQSKNAQAQLTTINEFNGSEIMSAGSGTHTSIVAAGDFCKFEEESNPKM